MDVIVDIESAHIVWYDMSFLMDMGWDSAVCEHRAKTINSLMDRLVCTYNEESAVLLF